jgi:hypothetical protein
LRENLPLSNKKDFGDFGLPSGTALHSTITTSKTAAVEADVAKSMRWPSEQETYEIPDSVSLISIAKQIWPTPQT